MAAILNYDDHLGTETVKIYIGPKRKVFVMHRKPLFAAAPYFERAMRQREEKHGKLYLPHDHCGAFALFVEWIYRTVLPDGHSQDYVDSLYELYMFAEKISLSSPTLEDRIMDKIQDISLKYDLTPSLHMIHRIYESPADGRTIKSSALRDFCMQSFLYKHLLKADLGNSEEYKNAKGQELDAVHAICRDNPRLFKDYIVWTHLNLSNGTFGDPRERREDNPLDRCYFHAHMEGFPCHLTPIDKPDFIGKEHEKKGVRTTR
ncbi:uncharacterized protein LY89DRAFT_664434 [Mollisia scopiformis]|uniref:BTB domain-containing protein n=1 Tax=Mollisia scopiformis TaxID=149040 RepID=A0A194XRF5_MOLSC|nr:uncharacterized protein LY89DRAFT_664434 [Mollisia scopiformis]KUJ22634.1 hypothetical protein LY89DRAFT_664434 [Mollisia scopiformis]